jgi:hypothetical protein
LALLIWRTVTVGPAGFATFTLTGLFFGGAMT